MTSTLPLADTRDMIGLHEVFRQALTSPYAAAVPGGDTARVELVGSYLDNVLKLLHAHHEGEDELMTPRLLERCTPAEALLVSQIADMHGPVMADIAAAETVISVWRTSGTIVDRDAVVAALAGLNASLIPHLDQEEQVVLPIAGRYLYASEWGELPSHGMRTFTGDKLWLILGLVQEQMPAPAIEQMEAHMPPPVLHAWQSSGRNEYAAFITTLRNIEMPGPRSPLGTSS